MRKRSLTSAFFILLLSIFTISTVKTEVFAQTTPKIAIVSLEHVPFVEGDNNEFYISAKDYTGQVQYQLFYIQESVMKEWKLIDNEDMTNGWTNPIDAQTPISVDTSNLNLKADKYRFAIRVRRVGVTGLKQNKYGDYDDSYPFNVEVVKNANIELSGNINIEKTNFTNNENLVINGVGNSSSDIQFKLHLFDVKNSKWLTNLTEYNANVNYSLKNITKGTYIVDLWVKNSNSKNKYDGWKLKTITVGNSLDKDEVINFADPALELLIRKTINKPEGNITSADVLNITSLVSIYEVDKGDRIRNLSGIENLTNLGNLKFTSHLIKDLLPLKALTKLSTLNLYDNRISSIESLSNLKNIENLNLSFNFIEDISPLKELNKVKELSLYQNDITELNILSNLYGLETLDIGSNAVNDVKSLSKLEKLKSVRLLDNPIADLSPIKRLFTDVNGKKVYQQTEDLGKKAKEIIDSNITMSMGDDDKLKILSDYIVLNNTYDQSEYNHHIPTKTSPYTAYGALCEGYSVCDGYARAYKILCRLVGLKVDYIVGDTSQPHAWNAVKINNEITYVDVTFSDPDKGSEIRNGYFKMKYDYLIRDRKWDIEKYPKPENINFAQNSKSIRIKINSEQPIENEMLVWVSMGVSGGINDGHSLNVGTTFAVPVVFRKGTEETDVILNVPESDYELLNPFIKDGTAKYGIRYSIYYGYEKPDFERESGGCNKKTGWLAYNEIGNFKGFDSDFGITLLKKDSRGIDYDKANYINNYMKNKTKYQLNGDEFKVYIKKTNTYPTTTGSYKENVYYLKNEKDFTLPPYSILYLATDTNVMSLPTDNRPNLMQKILLSNNNDKNVHYSAEQLDYSLQWIFTDTINTQISPDGKEQVVSSKDAYVRLAVFDEHFDEKTSCEKLIQDGHVIDMSDWLKTDKDTKSKPAPDKVDTSPVDFKPSYGAGFTANLDKISFGVSGTLTDNINTRKLRYITSDSEKNSFTLAGTYTKVEFTSTPKPGQYFYLTYNSETTIYIVLTQGDANAIKELDGYGNDATIINNNNDRLVADNGWYPNATNGIKYVSISNEIAVSNNSNQEIASVHYFDKNDNEIGSSGTSTQPGEEFSIIANSQTSKIVFHIGTYTPNVKPTSGKMKIVQVDVNVINRIAIDNSNWITVDGTNFGTTK